MRILALENEPSSARGGQELSLYDVCRGLAARGHHVELLHTRDGDLVSKYADFTARIDRAGGYAIDRSRPLSTALRLFADAWQWRRPAPDVVYANQYQDSLFARVLAMRFERPFVCHVRLSPPDRFCGQYRWGMGGAIRLIAISRAMRDEYVATGFHADRIDVVYNGIDVAEWHSSERCRARQLLDLPENAVTVGFAGRVHHQKGIDVLIDALALLPRQWRVAIAGTNHDDGSGRNYERELRVRADERGVADRIHWLGRISRIDVFYSAVDVVVLPAVLPEAFGRTLIESMACGTPVVASRIGGMPEVLTGEFERGLCEPRDPASLADCLQAVRTWRVTDPALAERCRAHVATRFTIADTVPAVERVLEGVVAEWRSGVRTRRAVSQLPARTGASHA
jgi:glycosyltransferase involved in cell wall biosynthesis